MARRVPKQSRDWYGMKKSANDIIKRFLAGVEDPMFGDILDHLEKEGIKYSKKGLHLRLEKLMKEGIIEKKDSEIKPYPTYHLVTKGSDKSGLGWWFRYYMEQLRWHALESKLNDKQVLRVMTTLIGVYAIFAEIQSWKMISHSKSYKDNFDTRSSFLVEALPLVTATSQNEYRQRYFMNKERTPGMYANDDYRNTMFEYEDYLKKTFPIEFKLCTEAFDAAMDVSKNFNLKPLW